MDRSHCVSRVSPCARNALVNVTCACRCQWKFLSFVRYADYDAAASRNNRLTMNPNGQSSAGMLLDTRDTIRIEKRTPERSILGVGGPNRGCVSPIKYVTQVPATRARRRYCRNTVGTQYTRRASHFLCKIRILLNWCDSRTLLRPRERSFNHSIVSIYVLRRRDSTITIRDSFGRDERSG